MRLDRRFAGAAVGVALLAGAGGAYAVGSGSSDRDSEREAFLGDVAKRLDVSPDKLNSALKGAMSDKLDRDVAAGRLTQKQADEIKKHLDEHGGLPFPGAGPPGPPPGAPPPGALPPGAPPPPGAPGPRFDHHRGPPGPIGAGFDAAAKYLGLTRAELQKKLAAGKSLADVARDEGKSVDGLKSAIKASVNAELDEHIDDLVTAHPGDRPPRPPAPPWDRRHERHHP